MEELTLKTDSKLIKSSLIFSHGDMGQELLRIAYDGDIFVKGNLIENDKEVVDALREFLIGQGFLKEKENE